MADFTLKQHDTWPPMVAVLSDSNAPIDLTGSTIKMLLKTPTGGTSFSRTCTIVAPATDGRVRYDWISADTAAVNSFNMEFEITFPGGAVATVPNIGYYTIDVLADLG
jgi:hypothetical protein